MSRRMFEINKVRHLIKKKAGRRITEIQLSCLYDGEIFVTDFKKIKMNGWKYWFPAKQYCTTRYCGKRAILLRTKLAKKLQSNSLDDRLVGQYVLWKMITRTPMCVLLPILTNGFVNESKTTVDQLEILVN